MKCELLKDTGSCPLCRKPKEKMLFILRSEVYNGKLCGEHLHSLIPEQEQQKQSEHNGTVHQS